MKLHLLAPLPPYTRHVAPTNRKPTSSGQSSLPRAGSRFPCPRPAQESRWRQRIRWHGERRRRRGKHGAAHTPGRPARCSDGMCARRGLQARRRGGPAQPCAYRRPQENDGHWARCLVGVEVCKAALLLENALQGAPHQGTCPAGRLHSAEPSAWRGLWTKCACAGMRGAGLGANGTRFQGTARSTAHRSGGATGPSSALSVISSITGFHHLLSIL